MITVMRKSMNCCTRTQFSVDTSLYDLDLKFTGKGKGRLAVIQIKSHEVSVAAAVDYVGEITTKESCKYGRYG